METMRLRNLQQPSQTKVLLEALVSRGDLLPKGAFQIRDPKALTPPLQPIVARANSEGRIWAAWATAHHIWLFTCEMSLHQSRERGMPVLLVDRYGEDGELQDAGAWAADVEGRWQRCGD
jgi:hypothetical protein